MGIRSFFLERQVRTYPANYVVDTNHHQLEQGIHVQEDPVDSGLRYPLRARPSRKEVVFQLSPDYNMENALIYGKKEIKPRVALPGGGMLEWDERYNIYVPIKKTYGSRFELH